MRDLEQLQEQDPDERGRRVGAVIMAAVVTAGLTLAIGQVIGQSTDSDDAREHDPLDQLDRVATPAPNLPGERVAKNAPPTKVVPKVDTTKLTFERDLTEHEERPEVIAALAAAAREEQKLATDRNAATAAPKVAAPSAARKDQDEDEDDSPSPAAQPPVAASANTVATATPNADEDAQYLQQLEQLREERAPRALPASVSASSAGRKLAKTARHDKLVAEALPKPTTQPHARAGEEGEFTLQVISYDTQAAAQAFATGLRGKGYEAFVASGDVDGRGRYYRVRIGPFKTKPQAEAYRHDFEAKERMNTIVVKRVQND